MLNATLQLYYFVCLFCSVAFNLDDKIVYPLMVNFIQQHYTTLTGILKIKIASFCEMFMIIFVFY